MKRALVPALVAGVAAAGIWWGAITSPSEPALEASQTTAIYDFLAYYRPNARYAFARLAAGDLPLWSPLQSLGTPLLATLQAGVLYPPNWLHAALEPQPAFALLAALHLALAAGLTARLAAVLGAPAIAAGAAGVLYAASVQLFGAVWTPNTLYTAAWLPGVLLAADRAALAPSAARAVALGAAVALQALAGWPYTLTMTAVATALYGAGALIDRTRAGGGAPLGAALALGGGALLGGLLAAPQLLPATELIGQSVRALGTLAEGEAVLIAQAHDPAAFWRTLVSLGANDGVPGPLALAVALLALPALLGPDAARREATPGAGAPPRRGRLVALALLALAALLVSFGDATPVYGWIRALPLLGDFRFPFRWRLVSTLALALLAGLGIAVAVARLPLHSRGARSAAAALVAAVVVVPHAAVVARGQLPFPRGTGAPRPVAAERVLERLRAELGTAPRERVFWHTPTEQAWADKLGQATGLPALQDLEPVTLATSARFLTFLQSGRASTRDVQRDVVRAASPYRGSVPFYGWVGLPADASRARLLDLASVRFVVSPKPPGWLDERLVRRSDPGSVGFAWFENPHALPWARRALRAEPEPADPEAALGRLVAPDFDARGAVLLHPLPPELAGAGIAGAAAAAGSSGPGDGRSEAAAASLGETVVERAEPEHLVIRTRGPGPAALVVGDAFFPGWEATVDGEPAPILRANTAFRAVAVPAGEHRVEMRYRPRSFRLGLALAGVAAAGAALAVALERRRRGRARLRSGS